MKVIVARNPGGREIPMPEALWLERRNQGYVFISEHEEPDVAGPKAQPAYTTAELERQGKAHRMTKEKS